MGFLDWLLGNLDRQSSEDLEVEKQGAELRKCFDRAERIKEGAQSRVYDAATEHIEVLARKRQHLCIRDDYGKIDQTAWLREIEYFIAKVAGVDALEVITRSESERWSAFGPGLSARVDAEEPHRLQRQLASIEDTAVRKFSDGHPEGTGASGPLTGLSGSEFEGRCADHLRRLGWNIRFTECECYPAPLRRTR